MASFPGYLRPSAPAGPSRPGSLLDILGALGPGRPTGDDPGSRPPGDGSAGRADADAAAASRSAGVGAPGHG